MSTFKKTHENISALVDGELSACDMELVLALLDAREGQAAWSLYHRIGDALRTDRTDCELSDTFCARLAARLGTEPLLARPQPARAAPPDCAERSSASTLTSTSR